MYQITFIQDFGESELERREETVLSEADTGVEDKVINLYPQMKYQMLEGFGGALTDAAGYVYSLLDSGQKEELLSAYFDSEQMNYQKVRIPMDSCDFSTHMYEAAPYKDDEKLEHFSFADTERYILPLLEDVRAKLGEKLKIMLSPWSPPAYMKTNGKRKHGGSLKKEYYGRWAEYICRYILEFQKRGYEVERISLQNEPKAVQTWDSCVYTAQEEKLFLQDYMVPALERHGLGQIEIFIWDHNKERLFERACEIIDRTTDSMIAGAAFHWYSGDHFESLDLFHEKFPDKKLILSESCLEYSKFDAECEVLNAARLAHDMMGNLNHGLSSFYDWNILLNTQGGPNHVGNFCDAPFLFDENKKVLHRRRPADYYWHFSHFIQPGARRIGYSRYTDEIDVTAWENPDGRISVILLNRTSELLKCILRFKGEMVSYTLQPQGIASGIIEEIKRK